MNVLNIPNFISVSRIFLVPLVIWLIIENRMQSAFVVFIIAGISDAVDGFLAKNFGWQTELGAYLDPIADKMLLMSIYVSLGLYNHIPVWLVIAVVSRDVLIIGAILLAWMLAKPIEVKPLIISKLNTLGQILLATLVLGNLGFQLGWHDLTNALAWVVGILTLASGGAYLLTWLKHMAMLDSH